MNPSDMLELIVNCGSLDYFQKVALLACYEQVQIQLRDDQDLLENMRRAYGELAINVITGS